MGGITWWLYDDMALGGGVLAMVLNLLVASMMGSLSR
jgi:magnesium transporter